MPGIVPPVAGDPVGTSDRGRRRLTPTRLACRSPASVTTGTPIQSASQVVVVPWYGNGVERHVHPGVGGQVLGLALDPLEQLDPSGRRCRRPPSRLRTSAWRPAPRARAPFRRSRDPGIAARSRPQARRACVGDLGEVVEAAEGHRPPEREGGGRRPGPRPGARSTTRSGRTAPAARCRTGPRRAGGIGDFVHEPVIHRPEPVVSGYPR